MTEVYAVLKNKNKLFSSMCCLWPQFIAKAHKAAVVFTADRKGQREQKQ